MTPIRAIVITTVGTNCDRELIRAFQMVGASVESVHLNALLQRPGRLERFDLIGLPGGFSFGDAIAAGRIAATLMRRALYPALVAAVRRGVPIIAPCNGFQIALQIGLLPGPAVGQDWPDEPAAPVFSLRDNDGGCFVDRWVGVSLPANTRCVWTSGLAPDATTSLLPIAHAEGRFTVTSPAAIAELAESGRIAVRYDASDNPNGSAGDVAGICDASGLVFGLMPHPERYTRWTHHPCWPRLTDEDRAGDPPGLAMFRNAVAHVQQVTA